MWLWLIIKIHVWTTHIKFYKYCENYGSDQWFTIHKSSSLHSPYMTEVGVWMYFLTFLMLPWGRYCRPYRWHCRKKCISQLMVPHLSLFHFKTKHSQCSIRKGPQVPPPKRDGSDFQSDLCMLGVSLIRKKSDKNPSKVAMEDCLRLASMKGNLCQLTLRFQRSHSRLEYTQFLPIYDRKFSIDSIRGPHFPATAMLDYRSLSWNVLQYSNNIHGKWKFGNTSSNVPC